MIQGHCHTNLDDYQREEWPKMFVAVPKEGDWVEAQSGKVLTVCKVTHCIYHKPENWDSGRHSPTRFTSIPKIKVELTKRI